MFNSCYTLCQKFKNVFDLAVPESHVRQQEVSGGIPHR